MIYIDIETLPTTNPAVIKQVRSNLKAPSNYKDAEKIAAYIESNAENAVHKTGLSGLFGQVLCIGYAIDDAPVEVIYEPLMKHENVLLAIFREIACDKQAYCINTLVGHNILDFDAPFLSQRMMINGLKPLFRHGTKPWDMAIDDTMTMFACGKREMYSLKNLCLAFGVQSPKDSMSGSEVHQYWLDGRHDEIAEYCKRDVEATRSIYNAMTINK